MPRPKKYASTADRMAAYRARKASVNVTPDAVQTDVTLRNDGTEPLRNTTEQWRLAAQHYLRTGELPTPPARSPGFVSFVDCPDVPHDCRAAPWLGVGRGTAVTYKGRSYVLVARHRGNTEPDALEHGVVSEHDHAARLDQWCEHGRGWQCHGC